MLNVSSFLEFYAKSAMPNAKTANAHPPLNMLSRVAIFLAAGVEVAVPEAAAVPVAVAVLIAVVGAAANLV
jgi:hypothetical protein